MKWNIISPRSLEYNLNILRIHSRIFPNICNKRDAAPSLRTVKQPRWAIKSLPYFLLCCVQYIMKISGISVDLFLHNALEGTYLKHRKTQSWIPGVKCNISKMYKIVHCLISDLSWKCHENPSTPVSVLLLAGTDSVWKVEKSCMQEVSRNILTTFHIVACIIFDISWQFNENQCSHFPVMLLTDRNPNKQTYTPTEIRQNITFAVRRRQLFCICLVLSKHHARLSGKMTELIVTIV